MRILISVGDKKSANPLICANYKKWVQDFFPNADVVVADPSDLLEVKSLMQGVNGVVLTGGCDINPALYRQEQDPLTQDVDDGRDALEWAILTETFSRKIPLLGICRGQQITNAFLGGTLHQDIESLGLPNHKRDMKAGIDAEHMVSIQKGSRLASIVGGVKSLVNSSHHQSVDQIGMGLTLSARAGDGTIEALEGTDPAHWVMLVQWHPERMGDQTVPCAILVDFGKALGIKK